MCSSWMSDGGAFDVVPSLKVSSRRPCLARGNFDLLTKVASVGVDNFITCRAGRVLASHTEAITFLMAARVIYLLLFYCSQWTAVVGIA